MRPRLAHPFTIVPAPDAVWLLAGEDIRFALRGDELASWLPDVLRACDGRAALADVIALAPSARRDEARDVIAGLVGERVIVDGGAVAAHRATPAAWTVDGTGALADALRAHESAPGSRAADADPDPGADAIRVYAQDTLELADALATNARRLATRTRWMWTTIGPHARAFVGPLLLPDAGPCLECLVDHFRLRSPVPEVYELALAHRGPFAAAELPAPALAVVAALATWKLALAADELAPSALYALHVVEIATLEVSSHRVLINPECPACATRGT